jgi:hypothetical protein
LAAEAIQQIQTLAAHIGQKINSAAAATGMHAKPILNKVSNATVSYRSRIHGSAAQALRPVRPAAAKVQQRMRVAVAAAGPKFQATIRTIRPTLLNISVRGTTAAEALQRIRMAVDEARVRLSAVVAPVQAQFSDTARKVLAASYVQARQGVEAVAALAERYIEAITNEALKQLGISTGEGDEALDSIGLGDLPEELEEDIPANDVDSSSDVSSRRKVGRLFLLLVAAIVGGAIAFRVKSHLAQTRAAPGQHGTASPMSSGRATPKNSKGNGAVATPTGSPKKF